MNNGIKIIGDFVIISSEEWYQLKKENEGLKEEIKILFDKLETTNLR